MISVIHVNLENAVCSENPVAADWFRRWVAMERYITIPRLVTSEETRAACERLGVSVDRVIPGGVDLALFHPRRSSSERDRLSVTLYCDSNVQKGRESGVEAVQRLGRVRERINLCSVGEVTEEQAGVFDHNYGYLHGEDYAQVLRESDIFIYPSRYDGFPAPPLQAMASGTALVTTAVEGVKEYARDGENCLVAQPNSADSLCRQVERLVLDADLRKQLQTNGVKTAHHFSTERSADELLKFLQSVYEKPAQSLSMEAAR